LQGSFVLAALLVGGPGCFSLSLVMLLLMEVADETIIVVVARLQLLVWEKMYIYSHIHNIIYYKHTTQAQRDARGQVCKCVQMMEDRK